MYIIDTTTLLYTHRYIDRDRRICTLIIILIIIIIIHIIITVIIIIHVNSVKTTCATVTSVL